MYKPKKVQFITLHLTENNLQNHLCIKTSKIILVLHHIICCVYIKKENKRQQLENQLTSRSYYICCWLLIISFAKTMVSIRRRQLLKEAEEAALNEEEMKRRAGLLSTCQTCIRLMIIKIIRDEEEARRKDSYNYPKSELGPLRRIPEEEEVDKEEEEYELHGDYLRLVQAQEEEKVRLLIITTLFFVFFLHLGPLSWLCKCLLIYLLCVRFYRNFLCCVALLDLWI